MSFEQLEKAFKQQSKSVEMLLLSLGVDPHTFTSKDNFPQDESEVEVEEHEDPYHDDYVEPVEEDIHETEWYIGG